MSETPMTCAACGQVMIREGLSVCPHCGRDLHPAAEKAPARIAAAGSPLQPMDMA